MTAYDAVAELLDALCVEPTAASFAARFGTGRPSEFRPGGVAVDLPDDHPCTQLDIRPWDDDGIGVIDVEPRADAPLVWETLQGRFGPFQELVRHGPHRRFGAQWPGPANASADAVVLVSLDRRGEIVELTLRRDPRA